MAQTGTVGYRNFGIEFPRWLSAWQTAATFEPSCELLDGSQARRNRERAHRMTESGPEEVNPSSFSSEDRSRLRRIPARGSHERRVVHEILDAARICHAAFSVEGQPFVIPTLHGRIGDRLILHGAKASRLIRHAGAGHELCVAATLVDGVVLARSLFHSSMNYRSVVLFGRGRLVESDAEKLEALKAVSDHLQPGRWEDARQPSDKELGATGVVEMQIETATAKVRSGPPGDDEEDYTLPIWAGVVPIVECILEPEADPRLTPGIGLPDYLL